jgi:malonate-semialdehyde dehydrogenase (acetylating)/methylmalonate-semialdehyde dehydrogenase
MRQIDHFIAGSASVTGGRFGDVMDPNNGGVQARVALGDAAVLERAVQAALAAQPAWAMTNPQRRARVMFEFKRLVEANMDALAHMLSSEHGKVIADSKGDIQRGLEVIEFCCGIPHVLKGEYTQGAGPGIDVYSMRQPIGIGAGITPFNFPAMIPLWMSGVAIATGNAFIIKPSERDPSVPVRLAELFIEAGLPEGICQVVHGDKEMVDAILDHPAIGAVSFVGSSDIAHYVYNRGVANGKRVQAMGGAKNHGIVMPDADLDQVVNDLAGAAFGSAGERCMALPVVVPVGDETAERLKAKLIPAIEALRIGISTDSEAHYGPVVTQTHKEKVEGWIQTCVDEGAELVVDGRGFALQGHEKGFFIGPTLFDHVTTDMESYKEEIFGPTSTEGDQLAIHGSTWRASSPPMRVFAITPFAAEWDESNQFELTDYPVDVCRRMEGGGRAWLRRDLCVRGIGRDRARPAGSGADHGGDGLWLPRHQRLYLDPQHGGVDDRPPSARRSQGALPARSGQHGQRSPAIA